MLTKAYTDGFHGTSLSRANEILSNGFKPDTGRPICFATPDNRELVHEFGPIHAKEDDGTNYGVVHADFPETAAELWPITLQVRIPAERAAEISVRSVTIFHVSDSGLFLPASQQAEEFSGSRFVVEPEIQY